MSKDNNRETNFENVHWADNSAQRVIDIYPDLKEYVVASGVTPSGIVHVGHFREIITTELVRRALESKGKKTKFIYSWDSYDAFRKVPKNIPARWEKHLRLPNSAVPDPWGCHESFAEHWMQIAEEALGVFNFPVEYQRQHLLQTSGIYADEIKRALNSLEQARGILDKYRKEPLSEEWFPLTLYCEKCGKDTTSVSNYDGNYTLDYVCKCGFKNTINFKETPIVKLSWRIDWPMRWFYYKESFEPCGKDHASTGGSWATGKELVRGIWDFEGPVDTFYTNVRMKGQGGKVSSSTGTGATLHDVLEIFTPELVIFLFAGTRPNAEFDISFDLDVIKIYEDFDRLERLYYGLEEEKNPKKLATLKRVYELSMPGSQEIQKLIPFQPSFRMLTVVSQANDFDYDKVRVFYEKDLKTEYDAKRLEERFSRAKAWVEKYAPDEMKFVVKKKVEVKLDIKQKGIVKEVRRALEVTHDYDKMFSEFRRIAQVNDVQVKDFFALMYNVILGKEKGPKLAEFMIDNKEKVMALLKKV
jgi:lysyl-tRNA synthetase, class I